MLGIRHPTPFLIVYSIPSFIILSNSKGNASHTRTHATPLPYSSKIRFLFFFQYKTSDGVFSLESKDLLLFSVVSPGYATLFTEARDTF